MLAQETPSNDQSQEQRRPSREAETSQAVEWWALVNDALVDGPSVKRALNRLATRRLTTTMDAKRPARKKLSVAAVQPQSQLLLLLLLQQQH
jgi:hypothetical protein